MFAQLPEVRSHASNKLKVEVRLKLFQHQLAYLLVGWDVLLINIPVILIFKYIDKTLFTHTLCLLI